MLPRKVFHDHPVSIQLQDRNDLGHFGAQNHNSFASAASHSTLRKRRRPIHPIEAMSLVAVKNLFFHRKLVQNDQSSPARPYTGPLGWNSSSEQPLLSNNATRFEEPDENSDIESQHTAVGTSENPYGNLHVGFGPIIRDFTIGLSDGLTVPFALTAGLSALGRTDVVIYGGIAEIIAGAISMGLGGWLGAKSEL